MRVHSWRGHSSRSERIRTLDVEKLSAPLVEFSRDAFAACVHHDGAQPGEKFPLPIDDKFVSLRPLVA
jgi:hypothetical protein